MKKTFLTIIGLSLIFTIFLGSFIDFTNAQTQLNKRGKQKNRQSKHPAAMISLLSKLNIKNVGGKKNTDKYFLLTSAIQINKKEKKSSQVSAYLLKVDQKQIEKTKYVVSKYADNLNAIPNNFVRNVKDRIQTSLVANIRGATVSELEQGKLKTLLNGGSIRISNSQLAADAVEATIAVGGAYVAVAEKYGSAVTVSELIGASGALEVTGVGLVAVGIGYGSYQATSATLDFWGANTGYTLGDFIYDLTHPDEDGNPIWNNDDESAQNNNSSGSNSTSQETNSSQTNSSSEENTSNSSNSSEGNSSNDNSNSTTGNEGNSNTSNSNSNSGGSSGTTLPDSDNVSNPQKNIEFLIAMGLFSGTNLDKFIVTRPVTMAGQPIGDGTITNVQMMLYFDSLLGGYYFKLFERGFNARRNSTGDPNPINENSSASSSQMIVDFTRCPSPDIDSAKFNSFIKSKVSIIQKTRGRK